MNEVELGNTPIKCPMAGKDIPFRQMSMARRRSICEAYYIERVIREIQVKATIYKDHKKREKYVDEQMEKIPSGDALARMVNDCVYTEELVLKFMMETCADDSIDELAMEEIVEKASNLEVRAVFALIIGGKKNYAMIRKLGDKSAGGSGKSTARRSRTSKRSRKRK